MQDEQPQILRALKEQEKRAKMTKTDPAERKRLEDVVKSKKIEFDKANNAATTVQEKVDAIVRTIEEKVGGKIKAIDNKIKEATKIFKNCGAEITKLNVAIKTSHR